MLAGTRNLRMNLTRSKLICVSLVLGAALLDLKSKRRFRCSMKFFICAVRIFSILLGPALLLNTGCKPKKPAVVETPSAPAPATPATNSVVETKPAPAGTTITPEEAGNHIGKIMTVRGKVDRVHVSQKGDVFIDMGGKHPNATFTAICFKQVIPTAQLEPLAGKTISISGKIKEYNGKVEIILESADQIAE